MELLLQLETIAMVNVMLRIGLILSQLKLKSVVYMVLNQMVLSLV